MISCMSEASMKSAFSPAIRRQNRREECDTGVSRSRHERLTEVFKEGRPTEVVLSRRNAVMAVDDDFAALMARAKAGDQAAIRLFLSRFGREVQMMVRARLPQKLRGQYDSSDFVQAVWLSFFSELPRDAPIFQKVVHLRQYLAGVARNKIFEQHRRLTRTEKYDICREERLYIRRNVTAMFHATSYRQILLLARLLRRRTASIV